MRVFEALAVLSSVLAVPYVPQVKEGCGAAALAMVMQYWWNRSAATNTTAAEPARIMRELYDPALHGIDGAAMEQYLRKNGFSAFAIDGQASDLYAQLQRGRPLIACLKLKGNRYHYVVVVGQPEPRGQVWIHDPVRGPGMRMDWSAFQRAWNESSNWLLIATPNP